MWLVFEVPTWLHYAKMIRVYSLYYAVIWNFIFFIYLRKAYSIISHADEETFTTMDFFTLFFLGYNIWLHGPIFLINSIIIFKEVLFEMIQMRYDEQGYDDDISLGLVNFIYLIRNVLHVMNPFNWPEILYYIIYGYY